MKAGETVSLVRQQCEMQMWPLAVPFATGSARDSARLLAGLGAQLMTQPDRVSVRA